MTRLLLASLLAAASAVALHAQTQTPSAAPAGDAPQIGRFGFDEAGMMKTTPPGDDFYAYANGEWAKTTAIPADKASYGAFDTLADLSRDRTRGIL